MEMKKLVLSILVLTGATLSAFPSGTGPSPVPNQDCGVSTTGHSIPSGTPVSGCGDTGPDAYWEALENASGVVCEICETGVQCTRDAVPENSSSQVLGAWTKGEDGYCFSGIVLSASIAITCNDC